MMNKRLSLVAAVAAASLLAASAAVAQPSQNSKPSPYQGVSNPPPDDTILTTEEAPAPPPVKPAAEKTTPAATATQPPDEEKGDAELTRRPEPPPSSQGSNGDYGIVTYIPGPANALPEGTTFRVHMLQPIVAGVTLPGSKFRARLSQNLTYDGHIAIPAGTELDGTVVYAITGRRITGDSVVHLRPDEFVLPNGRRYLLHAEVIDTEGSNTKASGEGNIVPKAHGDRALVELAATSGGGALVGAAVGGPVGAAVGSTIGAGVSGARWFLDTQSVDIPAQSTVIFSLTDPLFLTPGAKQD
jgi:hypothetical protein